MSLGEDSHFYSYESVMPTTEIVFADNFEQAFKALGPDNSFAFFDLGLTTEEKEMFDLLDVQSNEGFNQGLKSNFNVSYAKYLADIGNDEALSLSISSILEKILQNTKNFVSDSPMIYSYATSPEFLNPPLYWHIDQDFDFEVLYRVSIALKGPGTMFCKLSESGREDAINTLKAVHSIFINNSQDPKSLVRALINAPNPCAFKNSIYQVPSYFGAVFIAGGTDLSAIHTAPIVSGKRIVFTFGL